MTTNITLTGTATGRPFYMGGDKFAEWWLGRLDEVAIWSDALPASSIAGLAEGTLTPLTAPRYPVGVFDLADAVGGGNGCGRVIHQPAAIASTTTAIAGHRHCLFSATTAPTARHRRPR